jgi:hypothetical protein
MLRLGPGHQTPTQSKRRNERTSCQRKSIARDADASAWIGKVDMTCWKKAHHLFIPNRPRASVTFPVMAAAATITGLMSSVRPVGEP